MQYLYLGVLKCVFGYGCAVHVLVTSICSFAVLDSVGKPTSGFFMGSKAWTGNMGECESAVRKNATTGEVDFTGRYSYATFKYLTTVSSMQVQTRARIQLDANSSLVIYFLWLGGYWWTKRSPEWTSDSGLTFVQFWTFSSIFFFLSDKREKDHWNQWN